VLHQPFIQEPHIANLGECAERAARSCDHTGVCG